MLQGYRTSFRRKAEFAKVLQGSLNIVQRDDRVYIGAAGFT